MTWRGFFEGAGSALKIVPNTVGSALEYIADVGYYVSNRTIDVRDFAGTNFARYGATIFGTAALATGIYLYCDGFESVKRAYNKRFPDAKVEVKCIDQGIGKDCNYLQTPAYDIIYKLETDENGKVRIVELKKSTIESKVEGGNVVIYGEGRELQQSPKNTFKVTCKKFGDLGEKCDLLKSTDNPDMLYLPILKYNGRLDRVDDYDIRAVGVRGDLNRPGNVLLTDLGVEQEKQKANVTRNTKDTNHPAKKANKRHIFDAPRRIEIIRIR